MIQGLTISDRRPARKLSPRVRACSRPRPDVPAGGEAGCTAVAARPIEQDPLSRAMGGDSEVCLV